MLTAQGMRLYDFVTHTCQSSSGPVPAVAEMLQPGWERNAYVREFFARNTLGRRPAYGPLLLIGGEADATTPYEEVAASVVSRLCEQKDHVLWVKYPRVSASALLGNSVREQVSCIGARFSGLPAAGNCH